MALRGYSEKSTKTPSKPQVTKKPAGSPSKAKPAKPSEPAEPVLKPMRGRPPSQKTESGKKPGRPSSSQKTGLVLKPMRGRPPSQKTESGKKPGRPSSQKTESGKTPGRPSSQKTESGKKPGRPSSQKTESGKKPGKIEPTLKPMRGRPPKASSEQATKEALKRPAASGVAPPPKKAKTGTPKVKASKRLVGLTALLLGLERRPDRREKCEKMLAEHIPWLEVEFFSATDGKKDKIPDTEVSKTWNTKCNALYGAYEDVKDKAGKVLHTAEEFADPGVDYEFSPGERGCAHSHYRMWQRVAQAKHPMLILEDDVQVDFERTNGSQMDGKTWTQRLDLGMQEAARKDIDVLYLGWSGFRDGNYKHHANSVGRKSNIVRKAEYVWTTVAYVLWPAGAKKLLKKSKPMNQPVDNFMGWECRESRLNSYVLLDEGDADDTWAGGIVTQLDFTGDSDIKKSDGGDQGDDPTKYLASKSK